MIKYVLTLALAIPLFASAQFQKTGNLSIFSEDGDKFILILNGEKQNEDPQSNIRIEELPQPYYNAKIIFEDKALGTISKNNLLITDADGVFMDVTYKIRKDKSGKAKMNYFSSIEVQENFRPPSGTYVHRFGESLDVYQGGTVRQTTTTTTTNGISANINVPGVSMNVNINEPDDVFASSTTTTTTRTTTTSNSGNVPPSRGNSVRCGNNFPMRSSDFNAAKNTIEETAFDETRLTTAKTIASSNCLSTDQVVAICNIFSFEDSKLAFAKYAYRFTTDPNNYFKVSNVFSFDSSKSALSEFIRNE